MPMQHAFSRPARFRLTLNFIAFRWVSSWYLLMLAIALLVLPQGALATRLSPIWVYGLAIFCSGLVLLWLLLLPLPRRWHSGLSLLAVVPLLLCAAAYAQLGLWPPASIFGLIALGIVLDVLTAPSNANYQPDALGIVFGLVQIIQGIDFVVRPGGALAIPTASGLSVELMSAIFISGGVGMVITQGVGRLPDWLRKLTHGVAGGSLIGLWVLQSIYLDPLYWILGLPTVQRAVASILLPWGADWLRRFDTTALRPRLALGLMSAAVVPVIITITVFLHLFDEAAVGRHLSRPVLFGVVMFFGGMCGLLAWWFAGRLTAALRTLARTVEQIPQGNYTLALPSTRITEIVNLGAALSYMTRTLAVQTEQRERMYAAEAQARQAAEDANAMKMKFLGIISHELRTPLASIKGFTTTLLATDVTFTPQRQREFLEIINQETDKLTGLVEQLLDLSRLQSGTLRIEPSPLPVASILASAMPQLQTLTRQHPLEIDAPPDLPIVLADAERVAQVLVNLVGNAVKFSPLGLPITIRLRADARCVYVCVIDRGLGIPPEQREKIFEAFYQIERREAAARLGAGLGLAICRGIIETLGGMIWVQDSTTTGTTITFTLPVAAVTIPSPTH